MLTRYAEFAPISATNANTTSNRIRSRGPTAFTYLFFGNGAGIDSTEFLVVDIPNHPLPSPLPVLRERDRVRVLVCHGRLGRAGSTQHLEWFKTAEEDQSARYADQTGTKIHQSKQTSNPSHPKHGHSLSPPSDPAPKRSPPA